MKRIIKMCDKLSVFMADDLRYARLVLIPKQNPNVNVEPVKITFYVPHLCHVFLVPC